MAESFEWGSHRTESRFKPASMEWSFHPVTKGVPGKMDEIPVCFIGLDDLKANKRASGRNKDLADLDHLP
jgi:hypothetical protein